MLPSPAVRLLLRRFALLMGVYTLLRLGFYAFNFATFRGVDAGSVLLAFVHGLRFDVAALLWLNLPLVLFSLLLPVRSRAGQEGLRALFVLVNLLGFLLNIIDWQYFKFIGRRLSNEWHTISDDLARQAGQIGLHYWYLAIPLLGLGYLLWRLCPMPTRAELAVQPPRGLQWLGRGLEFALVVGLVVLGLRGGWQLKPLRTGIAFEQQPAVLGHLTLNSTFTVLKSFDEVPIERVNYFASEAALRPALAAAPLPKRDGAPVANNVVILLLESFGSEYTGVENGGRGGFTPFFDSLATAPGALLMRDNYANGRRSIEALPAVLSGLPSLMDEPFITSSFQTAEMHGLGEILGRNGYATAMYHAGTNGTMGFDMFSGIAGMQRYYGLNEYPSGAKSPDYDGHWGIFDEPYLQYFNRQLSATKQPFFATLFTLSAHDPFTIPAQHKGRFPAGTQPIHPTIAYTDLALRRFFRAASREPWFARTLFVLTADHTSQSDQPSYQNVLGQHKTPLLFYRPGQPLPPANPHRISQQADVPASVLDVLGLPQEQKLLLPFGSSVFDASSPGRALFRDGESYYLVHSDFVTELTNKNEVRLYPYQDHFIPTEPVAKPDPALVKKYGDELRACVQFYVNGLVDNRLYK
ncbi:LTA synthase family protein [Hymenobacter properus]|uniref:LTA synthase family protein n=1 Tax=Hymenobacter properus TaxID=2791026 RepID=A0A931BHU0_9BACT|nr:LTA synthase family protein [Hymenobacter properus]MBF9140463.1 LTA synthase family protein [Hymenobacter properus]MBR7719270.1 LTA synthase family protein [Microvirga sp. SRT04]